MSHVNDLFHLLTLPIISYHPRPCSSSLVREDSPVDDESTLPDNYTLTPRSRRSQESKILFGLWA